MQAPAVFFNLFSLAGAQLLARRAAERKAEARRAEAAKRFWDARWEARPRVETLDMETLDYGAIAEPRHGGAADILGDVDLDGEAFADARRKSAGAGSRAGVQPDYRAGMGAMGEKRPQASGQGRP